MRISDWSSDVCSSDLEILDPKSRQLRREMESATQYAQWRDAAAELDRREGLDQGQAEECGDEYDRRMIRSRLRSEERRVGKEWDRKCRSRWSQDHKKNKQQRNRLKATRTKRKT